MYIYTRVNIYTYVYMYTYKCIFICIDIYTWDSYNVQPPDERWGAGVETQKNVRGEIGEWGRVPFNEPYAPSLSTIYDEV